MKNIVIAVVIIVTAITLGFIFLSNNQKTTTPVQIPKPDPYAESTTSAQTPIESGQTTPGYQGKVLAGKSAPFLEFNKADYDKALAEDKTILLDFYANWCPICRAEAPAIHEGFNSLTSDKVIGFRVNYKDSDTDKDEEALAKDFKVPYQHTKVILKEGKEMSRSLDSWDKTAFDEAITKALN